MKLMTWNDFGWEALRMLETALALPGSLEHLIIFSGIAFVVLVFCLTKLHVIGGGHVHSLLIGMFISLLGVALLLATAVIVNTQLLPWLNMAPLVEPVTFKPIPAKGTTFSQENSRWLLLVTCLSLVFFIFLVPLGKSFFRTSYIISTISWITSLILAGFVVWGCHQVVDKAEEKGLTSIQKLKHQALEQADQIKDQAKEQAERLKEQTREIDLPAVGQKLLQRGETSEPELDHTPHSEPQPPQSTELP